MQSCGQSAGRTHSETPAEVQKKTSQWVLVRKDPEDKKQPVTSGKKTTSCCLSWQKQELHTFLVNIQEWVKRSFQLCPLLLLRETTCKSECWQIAQDTQVTKHLATLQPWRNLWNSDCFKYLRRKPKTKWHYRKREFKMHFYLEQFTYNIYVIFLVIKNCALNSVPLPEFFNWALSKQCRQVISSFYGLLLKYRGKQFQTLTMKPDIVWS